MGREVGEVGEGSGRGGEGRGGEGRGGEGRGGRGGEGRGGEGRGGRGGMTVIHIVIGMLLICMYKYVCTKHIIVLNKPTTIEV